MKEKSTRFLSEITLGTDHYLANLLALRKILGIPLSEAKIICKTKPDKTLHLYPFVRIISDDITDNIIDALEEYEITIRIINQ